MPLTPRGLESLSSIDANAIPNELGETEFLIASDVQNVLCGEHGAANVFGTVSYTHLDVYKRQAWNLPAIFLIENNQYAIATEIGWVAKETDLYKRAVGYGIEGCLLYTSRCV